MPDSSIDCCPCRLEWRPSHWHAAAVMVLWPLAVIALLATRWAAAAPPWGAGVLLLSAVGFGLWRARVLRREPVAEIELLPDGHARWSAPGIAPLQGVASLHEQWPVTVLRFPEAGTTVVFWPDTLCDSSRRALRRWARSATPASLLPQFWMG
ncbi:MAG: protein YgfX [Silanimonas sp.]